MIKIDPLYAQQQSISNPLHGKVIRVVIQQSDFGGSAAARVFADVSKEWAEKAKEYVEDGFSPAIEDLQDVSVPSGQIEDGDVLVYNSATQSWNIQKPVVSSSQRYEFSDALLWIVEHNRNTTKFFETLMDADGNRFYAKTKIIDENKFQVELSSALSGSVDVVFMN